MASRDSFFVGGGKAAHKAHKAGGGAGPTTRKRPAGGPANGGGGAEKRHKKDFNGHKGKGKAAAGGGARGGDDVDAGRGRGRDEDDDGFFDGVDEDEDRAANKTATFTPEELAAMGMSGGDHDDDDDDEESAAEKRVRLAKQYLQDLQEEEATAAGADDFDAAEVDRENIAKRLQADAMLVTGKLRQELADKVAANVDPAQSKFWRGHQLSLTALAISHDEKLLFTASKDALIIKWDLQTGERLVKIQAQTKSKAKAAASSASAADKAANTAAFGRSSKQSHTDQVLALAVTTDGKYLASGGLDKSIHIWEVATMTHRGCFMQHRGPVYGLVFRHNSHQLFSASQDRTVKIWDLDQMAYVETLFGHQESVTSIDCLARERCVSAGGRDRTSRIWKIVEESQMVFRGSPGSMDVIRFINDESFVSGDDQGSICLWNINKKKPIATVQNAHGDGNWIASLATIPYSDLVASGSSDGFIRLWKFSSVGRGSLVQVGQIEQVGFVNALTFSSSGSMLVAGLGQEHRMGRWTSVKEGKNLVRVIPIANMAGTRLIAPKVDAQTEGDIHRTALGGVRLL